MSIQEQMLAVLVMDLGYDSPPVYGHDPIRHQLAWHLAVEGMSEDDISARVKEMRKEEIEQRDVILKWRARRRSA